MGRILVTGSRNATDGRILAEALDQVAATLDGDLCLVHGDAPGVDRIAAAHARRRGWDVEAHPANWSNLGAKAGPVRNQAMVDAGADICLAFPTPSSRGTFDCLARARRAGIPTVVFEL